MFEAERYETVWQLTSTVAADLVPATSLADVFRALFPSGSVTGAPKVSTMRIIRDLEDSPRGVYCGAIGYLAPPGSGEPRADFNVAIRTVVVDAASGTAEYGVGGGITFDSSAELEHDEVLAKARVLTAARPAFELFETLRHDPDGGFRHLAEHLDRLGASARYFGFRFDPEAAVGALKDAVADRDAGPIRVRLALSRRGHDGRGGLGPAGPVRRSRSGSPSTTSRSTRTTSGCSTRPPAASPTIAAGTGDRTCDDVILVNTRGEVTESTIANLAVRLEGRWVTPPLESGLLPGTYRTVLVRDGTLAERPVTIEELRAAQELALVSSVRGWRAAELVP